MSQSDSALTSKEETSQDPWVQIRAGLNAIATIKARFESQFFAPLLELLVSKREQWEPIIKIARGIQALTPAERAAFLEVFETFLAEQLTYQYENASDLTALLVRRGWPRIEHYLSVSEIDKALGFGSDSEVDDFIVGIFAANDFGILRTVTARWNNIPYLADRHRIVNDALQAHIHGMYTLSVPALLPFVDGVAEVVVTELGNIAPSTEKQGATALKENTVKKVARLWDTGRHTPSSQIVREVV